MLVSSKVVSFPTGRKLSNMYAQKNAERLAHAIDQGIPEGRLVRSFRNSLSNLDVNEISKAADVFSRIASEHSSYLYKTGFWRGIAWSTQENWQKRTRKLVKDQPEICWFLMFHGNGYVRETAMQMLNGPPVCPFEVAAIVCRLNDWVPNVRVAAMNYALKYLYDVDSKVLGACAIATMKYMASLGRCDDAARALILDCIYHSETLAHLKDNLIVSHGGSTSLGFRLLLRRSDFDPHLEDVAYFAVRPNIRAIAIETLLFERARWIAGKTEKWVDKRYGVKHIESRFEERRLAHNLDRLALIERAVRDKSSVVRRVCADFMIANRHNLSERNTEIARELLNDKSEAVRMRMQFLFKKLQGG